MKYENLKKYIVPSVVAVALVALLGGMYYLSKQQATQVSNSNTIDQTSFKNQRVWDQGVVWDVFNSGAFSTIQDCDPSVSPKCVIDAMTKYGASKEAIDFYKQTEWFVVDFKDYGKIDLLDIVNPWRVNSNGDYALVNGTPNVVVVEDVVAKEKYGEEKQFPGYSIWATDNFFVKKDGNAFVFEFPLKNGYHKNDTGYSAVISFDFNVSGNYNGTHLVGYCGDVSLGDKNYSICAIGTLVFTPNLPSAGFAPKEGGF